MKKYMVEFTASVTGSMAGRDDGHPYRTSVTGTDRIGMIKLFKEKLDEKSRRYGWQAPKIFELEVTELVGDPLLVELEEYEKTKNHGEGI